MFFSLIIFSAWSEDGCYVESTNRSHTICMCNHLTNFAILMDIIDETNSSLLSIFDDNLRVFIYISIAICILLIIVALLTLKLFNGVFVKVRTNTNINSSDRDANTSSQETTAGENTAQISNRISSIPMFNSANVVTTTVAAPAAPITDSVSACAALLSLSTSQAIIPITEINRTDIGLRKSIHRNSDGCCGGGQDRIAGENNIATTSSFQHTRSNNSNTAHHTQHQPPSHQQQHHHHHLHHHLHHYHHQLENKKQQQNLSLHNQLLLQPASSHTSPKLPLNSSFDINLRDFSI